MNIYILLNRKVSDKVSKTLSLYFGNGVRVKLTNTNLYNIDIIENEH